MFFTKDLLYSFIDKFNTKFYQIINKNISNSIVSFNKIYY